MDIMDIKKLEIKYIGDEVLTKKSKNITVDENVKELSKNMIELMYNNNGIGLAAPQVGINNRLIAIDIKEYGVENLKTPGEMLLLPQMPIVLVNPEITAFSRETAEMEEGCLSVPEIFAVVERPVEINLRAQFLSGEKLNIQCGGFLSRVLQHEIDHLNGILFVDRLSEREAKRIKSKLNKLQKKLSIKK
ncbi:MAG: peptide deformylase [Victivallales bacterium]|nr:peptide deformylase [Victivallales bacterium]